MKYFFLITLFSFLFPHLIAQQNQKIMPDSYYLMPYYEETEDLDHICIAPPAKSLIKTDDVEKNDKDGTMYVIGILLPVDLTPENSGTWITTENGLKIWRLRLSSENAKAAALHFDYFKLQKDSRLFVYSEDFSIVLGPFTNSDNPEGLEYSIGVLNGNDIIIEYVLPSETIPQKSLHNGNVKKSDFKISAYSYIYRGEYLFFDQSKATGYGTSGECEVNVNCSEGNNWRVQQRGIARIYAIEGIYAGYCTGSLVNNTANDLTPYMLTANHCGENSTAANFRQWRFDFNYESPECISTTEPSRNSFAGCTKVAAAPLGGGSDFLLLKLSASKENLKAANVIYNGWRKNNVGSYSGVGIHHPNGDIKKISTYNTNLTTATYNGDKIGANNAHWRVRWTSTANGFGVTEGGSSGSPIFDNEGYIIGTLSGGSSYCNQTSGSDLYGKISYHWDSNGTTDTLQLKPWLDPINSGNTNCDFLDPNSDIDMIPEFTASRTTIGYGAYVKFTDISTSSSSINSWSWHFDGGTPSYSSERNPVIVYNDPGTYNVSLTITNNNGSKSKIKNNFIEVLNVRNSFSYDFEDCTDFSVDQFAPCTTYDGDRQPTYGTEDFDFINEGYTGSFIVFNASQTMPAAESPWFAYEGEKAGACFAAIDSPNNDWFISPQLYIPNNTTFSFWAKSLTDEYSLERFNVLVSTNSNNYSDFVKISSGVFTEAPATWNKYEYNLSEYAEERIYVAIQCVSDNAFVFMIDNIETVSPSSVKSNPDTNVSIYPNPGNGIFNIDIENEKATITVYNILGKEIKKLKLSSDKGKIDLSDQNSGIYFIEIITDDIKTIKKVSIY
ncbi:MAG: choice-of-anchor J domain-containing protein [Bacteroidales bacterium]|jgi:PKD repeat protein|nr:choice-of-anchor J domain-containing protein [Bacteroidales bacterium]